MGAKIVITVEPVDRLSSAHHHVDSFMTVNCKSDTNQYVFSVTNVTPKRFMMENYQMGNTDKRKPHDTLCYSNLVRHYLELATKAPHDSSVVVDVSDDQSPINEPDNWRTTLKFEIPNTPSIELLPFSCLMTALDNLTASSDYLDPVCYELFENSVISVKVYVAYASASDNPRPSTYRVVTYQSLLFLNSDTVNLPDNDPDNLNGAIVLIAIVSFYRFHQGRDWSYVLHAKTIKA